MMGHPKLVKQWAKLLKPAPTARANQQLWEPVGDSGMRYMEECDLSGGQTDCEQSNSAPTAREVQQAQTMREAKQRKREFIALQGKLFDSYKGEKNT